MLSQACNVLAGVGPALTAKLGKCGIHTLQDLIFHLPFRYQDRTRITPIQDVRANEWCVIGGSVCKTEIKYGKRPVLHCFIEDKTAIIRLRFFHFNTAQVTAMQRASSLYAFGEVREYNGVFEMVHPEYQLLQEGDIYQVRETLTPIYPSTQGLSQAKLRQLVAESLKNCTQTLSSLEWMQPVQLEELGLCDLSLAIQLLHNPPPDISLTALEEGSHPALRRLVLDELLAQRVSMQFAREHRNSLQAKPIALDATYQERFLAALPFTLTKAQQQVSHEVSLDLTRAQPMLRLVQGDVGSGKTVIAALAALQAVSAGFQVAFMAPTDLLTEQHAANLIQWLSPLGIQVMRLSGKMKVSVRRNILEAITEGTCQVAIGTHALFQEGVVFAKLALVIIDEQHRFGVEQRLLLQQKGQDNQLIPHQLLMTATPIPRTLAMSHFAHLDLSIINELPPGRLPIKTAVISQAKRDVIIDRLQAALDAGRQAYWVCTLIEESEKLQCVAASQAATSLQEQLTGVRVGLIHGRMKAEEKEATMEAFKQGSIDLLVATTVIEVGVDVPRASLMIIENAERLGLSQLHQLRGRVGRGSIEAHCLLLYQMPLSAQGVERLQVMRETQDGFVISEKDLALRGAGEVLGVRQTGYRQFRCADLVRDKDILPLLSPLAKHLIAERQDTARAIMQRWLGQCEQFLQG